MGTRTNRAALGAKLRVDLKQPATRRHKSLDLQNDRRLVELQRQQPRAVDRPGRRRVHRRGRGELAREPNDPNLPRPQAGHLRRDYRGSRRTPPDRTAAFALTSRSLVGMARSNARNSEPTFRNPLPHLLARPCPFERMGVQPIVLLPSLPHVIDEFVSTTPRSALEVSEPAGGGEIRAGRPARWGGFRRSGKPEFS